MENNYNQQYGAEAVSEDAGLLGDWGGSSTWDLEMLSDDAGQAGAADGETGEIEFTPEEAAAIPSQGDAGDVMQQRLERRVRRHPRPQAARSRMRGLRMPCPDQNAT